MNEDKAARYHRLRRRAVMGAAAWSVVLLAGLLLTGASQALRTFSLLHSAQWPIPMRQPVAAAVWTFAVALIHELGTLPFACFGGLILERRYQLSRQSAGEWLRDHLKALGLGLVLATAAGVAVTTAMVVLPSAWWLLVWIGAVATATALTWVAPVLLLPLFFTLTPLTHDRLRQRLLELAERVGAPALGIFEWRLSDRTSRANAMLTGMGGTRRILVSDTLVSDYEEDEIEVILAHELAHHVRHDVWRGLAVEMVVMGLASWAAQRVLVETWGLAGLSGPTDFAGLPLVVLTAMAVSVVCLPVANAFSRFAERRADRFALEITGNADGFVRAMRRLGARNLAEDAPSLFSRLFFHTHPPLADRIAFAQAWASAARRR